MPTNPIAGRNADADRTSNRASMSHLHQVVIVNGSDEVLPLFEAVLEAGRYNVVVIESNEHAYSRIRHVQPSLVILCVATGDIKSFQVLSMLKLDEATRGIPVLTCSADSQDQTTRRPAHEASDAELFRARPAPSRVN
jgi:CheY-like chemotaxis protein